jgi:hypothetical protein
VLTDSPVTSRLQFRSTGGQPIEQPEDWQPALVEARSTESDWTTVRIELQGEVLPVYLRQVHGTPCILADWPRSGPGSYLIALYSGPDVVEHRTVTIRPGKISSAGYVSLMADLEARLPAAIALQLQRVGGLSGLKLLPPHASTRAQELQRLRRAVLGHDGRPGLALTLANIASDPHKVLHRVEEWVPSERARRPVASRLAHSVAIGHNLTESGTPIRLVDGLVRESYDVYENRLVKTFYGLVTRRISRLARSVRSTALQRAGGEQVDSDRDSVLQTLTRLQRSLSSARRLAAFLNDVRELVQTPDRITMVLLNRPPYRAALEAYHEFLRSIWVRLEDPLLSAPLENFPRLYEIWGMLQIVAAVLETATEYGFELVGEQRLIQRDQDGLYVRLLPDGRPILVLRQPKNATEVRVIPQRSYVSTGSIRTISFLQRPDVTILVQPANGSPRLSTA